MKPNFALSLSFDGIKLLHRAAGGWREVGEVDVTSDDLAGELAMLRKTATSLEPGGLRTKLVIPGSQIKYLTIETMGLSDAARRKEAEFALENATPYAVSDLSYDISVDGPRTHVAAVARETLAEAEAFATEHRFHPVSFVAVPDDAPYLGEPFFGPTEGAADLLEPGDSVEPDGIAVVIVGAVAPEARDTIAPEARDIVKPEARDFVAPEADDLVAPEADDLAASEADDKIDVPELKAEKLPEVKQPIKPEAKEAALPEAPKAATANQEKAPPQAPKPTPDAGTEDKEPSKTPDVQKAEAPVAKAPAVKQPELDLNSGTAKTTEPAPVTAPVSSDTLEKQAAPAVQKPVSPMPAADIATVPAPKAPDKPAAAPIVSVPAPTTSAPAAPVVEPVAAAVTAPDAPKTSFSSRRAAPPVGKPIAGVQRIAVNTPRPDSSSLNKPAPAPLEDEGAAIAAPVAATAPAKTGFLSRRKPRAGSKAPVVASALAVPATGTEAERMTVFGARSQQVGGKPRFLGLVMTVVLLVFLAGVAAWAAVFLDDGIAGLMKEDRGRATASAPENQIDPEIIRTPEGVEASVPDANEAVQIAALDPVLSAEDTAVLDAMQDPRPEPQVPVISEAEAAARYAVTGIWPLAPDTPLMDGATTVTDVYRSSIDPVSTASDALALPSPGQFDTDVQLAAMISPPPFGQQTIIDESGLIVPTPEGVVTPEGFTLVAASPPLKPPAILTRPATEPALDATAAALSAIVAFRPQNRPLGLAERTERAQLGGVTLGELAVYRPSLRPNSIQDRARQAEEEAQAEREAQEEASAAAALQSATNAAAAAAAASALVVPQPAVATVTSALQSATRLATPQSRRPDTRPRNFARIVKRAQRAAPAPAEETRVAAAAASVAPRTVTPSLPSKASVARSATVKNAINLRKVNLIGVYGKPNSRRALIRLSNGRYQKVQVGDRIDGGRVAAISNSELRYTKGGRNVVLTMP